MLGHSRQARETMRAKGLWTEKQDRIYRFELAGDLETVALLLEGRWTHSPDVQQRRKG